jgi:hypothetical protein
MQNYSEGHASGGSWRLGVQCKVPYRENENQDLLALCDMLDCFCKHGSLFDFLVVTHAVDSNKPLG